MTAPTTGTVPHGAAAVSRRNVEAILPLLSNQRALLLLRELNPTEDPGFLQVRFTLNGPLDLTRLEGAWRRAVDRHQALRMSIHDRDDGDPMAVIWRAVELPWIQSNWARIDPGEQERQMSRLLQQDRAEGLDFTQAPVMRVHVIRTGTDVHEVVWTCHHIFTDGWSAAIVLEDVMAAYHNRGEAAELDLRRYVAWATARDDAAVEGYWRDRLAGYAGAPHLTVGSIEPDAADHGWESADLSRELGGTIEGFASQLHVTPNAVFQAAWSVVLSRLFGSDDVVFGTTVAGRSAPIAGMERLVGYFSNAVPIRAVLDHDQTVADWLQALRNEQFEMQPFEHASLADVHRWSEVPGHRQLFETFLVFENFPTQAGSDEGTIAMSDFRSGLTAAFPLTIAVTLSDPWRIHLRFDRARCGPGAARQILGGLVAALTKLVEDPGRTVGELSASPNGLDALPTLSTPRPDGPTGARASRAPATDAEVRIAAIWEDLLDLDEVGVDDDYFALGGTSLGAIRLFGRIEEEFGTALPLHTLVRHSTVGGLAGVVTGETSRPAGGECLVPFQTAGDKPAIVCVHGGGGDVLFYRELASRLGEDQPVYGLEPVGLDGGVDPLESVPEMAARYIEELRSVQPDGPFRLVGYCFGGAVALEMSHQLTAMGEDVELLALIDSGLPLEAARATTLVARAAAVWRTRGPSGALKAAVRRLRHRGKLWWDGSFAGAEGRHRANRGQVAQACDRAFRNWEPRASSTPITLIRSSHSRDAEGGDFHFGWDAYSPQVDTYRIDTDHYSLFEAPAIDEMASVILARLPTDG